MGMGVRERRLLFFGKEEKLKKLKKRTASRLRILVVSEMVFARKKTVTRASALIAVAPVGLLGTKTTQPFWPTPACRCRVRR